MSGSLFQKLSGSLVDRTEVLYDNFVFHQSVIYAKAFRKMLILCYADANLHNFCLSLLIRTNLSFANTQQVR